MTRGLDVDKEKTILSIIISVAKTVTILRNIKEGKMFSLDETLSFMFINDVLGLT